MTDCKINFCSLVCGLQGQGKTHLAKCQAIDAARSRMRVFVLDPTGSFTDIATTYKSPADWASSARRAADRGEKFPAIARFLDTDPQSVVNLAIKASEATAHRVASLIIFDETLLVDAANDNYIAPWLKHANATRRHLGIGFVFVAQNAGIHSSLIDSATTIAVFRLVNAKQLRRLGELANIPPHILAGIPTLKPRQYRSGSPSSPESWR